MTCVTMYSCMMEDTRIPIHKQMVQLSIYQIHMELWCKIKSIMISIGSGNGRLLIYSIACYRASDRIWSSTQWLEIYTSLDLNALRPFGGDRSCCSSLGAQRIGESRSIFFLISLYYVEDPPFIVQAPPPLQKADRTAGPLCATPKGWASHGRWANRGETSSPPAAHRPLCATPKAGESGGWRERERIACEAGGRWLFRFPVATSRIALPLTGIFGVPGALQACGGDSPVVLQRKRGRSLVGASSASSRGHLLC